MSKSLYLIGGVIVLGGGLWYFTQGGMNMAGGGGDAVAIDEDDIGGVVSGPNGPEAGVWVVAETNDLDVRYIKIVVTDDEGRYVLPDLPAANYDVWARGYGLSDSAKAVSTPGRNVNIAAIPAASEAEAAHYYPAIYWYSMLNMPTREAFDADPLVPERTSYERYYAQMKNIGCVGCHQLGQLSTRTAPEAFSHLSAMICGSAVFSPAKPAAK